MPKYNIQVQLIGGTSVEYESTSAPNRALLEANGLTLHHDGERLAEGANPDPTKKSSWWPFSAITAIHSRRLEE